MLSLKQVVSTLAGILLIFTATLAMAAEETQVITGHIYCFVQRGL